MTPSLRNQHFWISPKRGLLRRGFLSGSLAIGSESAQPTSYHPTPRAKPLGVARFHALFPTLLVIPPIPLPLSLRPRESANTPTGMALIARPTAPVAAKTLHRKVSAPRGRVTVSRPCRHREPWAILRRMLALLQQRRLNLPLGQLHAEERPFVGELTQFVDPRSAQNSPTLDLDGETPSSRARSPIATTMNLADRDGP